MPVINTALLTALAEELAEYKDDLHTFWDTLDGETDVMDAVGVIIQDIVEADAQAASVAQIIERYQDRASAIKSRKEALKRSLKAIMAATGQTKIPHALATISLRKGSDSLVITNEEDIPSQLCKVTITPDKAAIKNQLKAGAEVPGAELVTGPETISMRMK